MQQFTTRKDGFREVRNKLLIATISGCVIGGFMVLYLVTTSKVEPDNSLVFTWMLFVPIMWFTTYQGIKRQKRAFESFRLTITEDAVIREQLNTPTITLSKNSIREITRTPGGIFCIIGESKLNAIGIPAQIENPGELERALSDIKPVITKSPWTPLVILQLAALFFVLVGGSIGLLSEDRVIFTISGGAVCAFLVFGFILIHRSKNYDRRMKRLSYGTIIPVLGIIAYVVMGWMEG